MRKTPGHYIIQAHFDEAVNMLGDTYLWVLIEEPGHYTSAYSGALWWDCEYPWEYISVSVSRTTQHSVILPTSEEECVAMVHGTKIALAIRIRRISVKSFCGNVRVTLSGRLVNSKIGGLVRCDYRNPTWTRLKLTHVCSLMSTGRLPLLYVFMLTT